MQARKEQVYALSCDSRWDGHLWRGMQSRRRNGEFLAASLAVAVL